jgi:hypothetical protein
MMVGKTCKVAVRRYNYHKAIWYNYKEAEVLDLSLGIYTLRVVYKTRLWGLIKHRKTITVGIENVFFQDI